MFSSILINRLILIILYVGVIVATSRQVIISLHLILIMILFIRPSRFNISSSKYLRKSKFMILTILILLVALIFIFFNEQILSSFILNEFSINIEARSTPSSIIIGDFFNVFKTNFKLFYSYPFYYIFGFGFYIGGGVGQLAPIIIGEIVNSELHYFYTTLTKYGLIGFLIYWVSFIIMSLSCWKTYRLRIINNNIDPNILLLGFILFLFIGLQLIHYSPYGIGTNFIIALAIFIASISSPNYKIQKNIVIK